MNLQISGRHVEITPAIHDYVLEKVGRSVRNFDHVIGVNVILSVEKRKRPFACQARTYMSRRMRTICMPRSTYWRISWTARFNAIKRS